MRKCALLLACAVVMWAGVAGAARTRMVIATPAFFWGIDEELAQELKAEGVSLYAYPDCPSLRKVAIEHYICNRLMDYNMLVFGDNYFHKRAPAPESGKMHGEMVYAAQQMKKFIAGGGGIWFSGLGEQEWGKTAFTLNYIMKELNLDAEVINEVVMDTSVQKQGSRGGEYAWVEVVDDPLTKNVKNVLHPFGVIAGEGSMGVVPIVKLGPEWRVLLRGSETAASFPLDYTPPTTGDKLMTTPKTVKSRPILCAVRETGKGRVVLWPTWSNYTVTGGSYGQLFAGERDGKKSDGAQLMKNLLYWLAEPAQGSKTVGQFDPKKFLAQARKKQDPERILAKWCVPGRKDYANQYKGLIGAHTSLSDGKNTPEEMIAAAKAAGYDFIAFTEDFSKMDEAKWKQLLALCDKVNKEDPNFRAFQGLDFVDEADNRGVVFGHRYWVTKELRSKKYPDRVEYWYTFSYKSDGDPKRWPVRIIIRSKANNKRPWYQGLWSFFGAYCYEGGKLVDDSFREYLPLVGRYFFDYNAGISVVHTVRSVEEVRAAANPRLYQCYVRADQLASSREVEKPLGVYDSIWTNCGPWKPDPETDRVRDYYPHYFPCYPSSGPEILDFRSKFLSAAWGADMAMEGNRHSMLHILVRAAAGLDKVEVYDGEHLVRRYRPEGTEFEHFMAVPNNEQHAYVLIVTDKAGGRAVSWPAWVHIQEFMHIRCGDNWNYNTHAKGRSGGAYKRSYHLLEVQGGWGRAGKKEAGPTRPVYGCKLATYNYAGTDAAVYYIWPTDWLVDDKPWHGSWYWPILVDCDTAGSFGGIATNRRRYDYTEKNPIPYSTLTFAGPYKLAPTPWLSDLRYIGPIRRRDGAGMIELQGKVTFGRKVSTRSGGNIGIRAGGGSGNFPDIVEIRAPGGEPVRYDATRQNVSLELPADAYACWYDAKGDGVGGIIALSPGLRFSYSKKGWGLGKSIPSPADPLTELTWDVVYFSGTAKTTNTGEQMVDLWEGMGFNGLPTLYTVASRVGWVSDQKLYLTVETEDGGFRGKIARTTDKLLPIHLPVWVKGLNPRWDAGIWYKGKTELEVVGTYHDQWGMATWSYLGRTAPRVDEVQFIPILDDGVGYCQVETDEQPADVFIGNFLVCDQPEVFLSLRKVTKKQCVFEINNPTDKTLTCTVRPARGFDLVGRFRKKIVLEPGAYEVIGVEKAWRLW